MFEEISLKVCSADTCLKSISVVIGCKWVEDALQFANGDHLYVGDEGKNDATNLAFGIFNNGQEAIFYGKAVVVGINTVNETETDCTSIINDITKMLNFYDIKVTEKLRQQGLVSVPKPSSN